MKPPCLPSESQAEPNDLPIAQDESLWDSDLALITTAAIAAGKVALNHFGQSPEVWWKSEGRSPVSEADYAANKVLEAHLLSARPHYGWLSEETEDTKTRLAHDTVFVVDPIDGTRAFLAGEKTWVVSVAVVHHGRPVAGVLVAPALEEIYQASDSQGKSWCNGVEIHVQNKAPDAKLDVASPAELLKRFDAPLSNRLNRVAHIPSLAYRIAYIASGAIDATIVFKNAHDWDLAAADLILHHAGGKLADLNGNHLIYNRPDVRHGNLLAAANSVLPALVAGFHGE